VAQPVFPRPVTARL